ncbi:MAG: c-type cytochrome [Verrucomicrobiia bacterium]
MKKNILILAAVGLLSAGLSIGLAADVKKLYEDECAKCHGSDGKGQTKMGKKLGVKDYTDPKVQAELKMDKALKALKEGLKEGDKTLMKPFDLPESDLKALVEYMKTFKK